LNALAPLAANLLTEDRGKLLFGFLDRIGQELDPTVTQHGDVQGKYEAVGGWVADAADPVFKTARIYPQGSFAIGTAIRPLHDQEFDVDLVCHFPQARFPLAPAMLKRTLGARLRENAIYAERLQEMLRCWRICYANRFHLDVTPSIRNPGCSYGGELVPDRKLVSWKASNPLGFKVLFDKRSLLQPRFRTRLTKAADSMLTKRAEVAPFPALRTSKPILPRTVQLLKRHRDIHFESRDASAVPISVILTTLAARSYEHCVTHEVFDTEFDLLVAIVEGMPAFIEQRNEMGCPVWWIENETTAEENFAEKWNFDTTRATAFFEWHGKLRSDLGQLARIAGLDILRKSLSASFGEAPVTKVMKTATETVGTARSNGSLHVAPLIGLTGAVVGASPVRANTFFGSD
jgi:hypothetical protein